MLQEVIARLEASVPALVGRTEGAMQFADLMKRNALPQATPAAFVLPLGLIGGAADAATGAFTQMVDQAVGVVLVIRSFDRTGARAADPLEALIADVLAALLGWGPDTAVGVLRLARGGIISMASGAVVYQLDFALADQLRVIP